MPSQATLCSELFLSTPKKVSNNFWNIFGGTKRFDLEAFKLSKVEIKSKLDAGQSLEQIVKHTSSVEGKLALIEVTAEFVGTRSFEEVIISASAQEVTKITKALKKFDFNQGFTIHQGKDLIQALYLISNSKGVGLERLIGVDLPGAVKQAIDQRIENELATTNFISAMQNLGLIRNLKSIERLKAWRARLENIEKGIISVAINTPSILLLGVPLHIPNLRLLRGEKISKVVIDDVKQNGFESTYRIIPSELKRRAGFDLFWSAGRKVYTGFMSAFVAYLIVVNHSQIMNTIDLAFVNNHRLEAAQEQTFNPQKIREAQLQSWKKAFFEFEGRWPDIEKNPSDRAEWQRVTSALQQTPNSELKAAFDL